MTKQTRHIKNLKDSKLLSELSSKDMKLLNEDAKSQFRRRNQLLLKDKDEITDCWALEQATNNLFGDLIYRNCVMDVAKGKKMVNLDAADELVKNKDLIHERVRALRLLRLHIAMDLPVKNKYLKKFLVNRFEEFENQWFDDEKIAKLDKVFKLGNASKNKTAGDTEVVIHTVFQDHKLKVKRELGQVAPRKTCKRCGIVGYEDEAINVFDDKESEYPIGEYTIKKAADSYEFLNFTCDQHVCSNQTNKELLKQEGRRIGKLEKSFPYKTIQDLPKPDNTEEHLLQLHTLMQVDETIKTIKSLMYETVAIQCIDNDTKFDFDRRTEVDEIIAKLGKLAADLYAKRDDQ